MVRRGSWVVGRGSSLAIDRLSLALNLASLYPLARRTPDNLDLLEFKVLVLGAALNYESAADIAIAAAAATTASAAARCRQMLPPPLPSLPRHQLNLLSQTHKLLVTLLLENIVTRFVVQTSFVILIVPISATTLVHFLLAEHAESSVWLFARAVGLAVTPDSIVPMLSSIATTMLTALMISVTPLLLACIDELTNQVSRGRVGLAQMDRAEGGHAPCIP